MNTVTFKPRIASSFQVAQKSPYNVSGKNHPVRLEIEKCIGTYELEATFEEDTQTTSMFSGHLPGVISFICTLRKKNGVVIGVGRGNGVINKVNKYVERSVHSAFNLSLLDAIAKSSRLFDALHTEDSPQRQNTEAVLADAYKARDSQGVEMITEKQKGYLRELIQLNVMSETERTRLESQMSEYTKSEASKMIQGFQK